MSIAMQFQPPVLSNTEVVWMAVHWLFMIAAAIGFILLIVWMAKNLKGKQLLNWTLFFIIVGLLGSFLTFRYEMDLLGKFVWGGSMSGTMQNGQLTPLRNETMNRMMKMMPTMDRQCETSDCQNDLKEMMMPMMEKMEDYMKEHNIILFR